MSEILIHTDAYRQILQEATTSGATLVAVSKTKPVAAIKELYHAGQRVFGENRARELEEKQGLLPKDILWHMIGHLQRNKVKYIAGFVSMIESVDSIKLLREIDKEAAKNDRIIDCLLEFKIAKEATKYGLEFQEVTDFLNTGVHLQLRNIRICGVMGMATFTDDRDQVRLEFRLLKSYFDRLKARHFEKNEHFRHISMGMSGDYSIALEEGSTMIRVGSLIFGDRD